MSDAKPEGFFLYDGAGKAYKFGSEAEVKDKLAPGAGGFAKGEGAAPSNWEEIAGKADDEVGGRDTDSSGWYHTYWKRGWLWFSGEYGLYGYVNCVHRHYSVTSAAAEFDSDYPMWE